MRNEHVPPVAILSSRGGTRHRHLALVREALDQSSVERHDIPLPWEEAFHPLPVWMVNLFVVVFGATVVAVVVSRLAGWVTL